MKMFKKPSPVVASDSQERGTLAASAAFPAMASSLRSSHDAFWSLCKVHREHLSQHALPRSQTPGCQGATASWHFLDRWHLVAAVVRGCLRKVVAEREVELPRRGRQPAACAINAGGGVHHVGRQDGAEVDQGDASPDVVIGAVVAQSLESVTDSQPCGRRPRRRENRRRHHRPHRSSR
jgi:hypothetical protein